jgi:hypothetical protein
MWPVELAYFRARPEAAGLADEALLAEHRANWEANLLEARALIPPHAWDAFRADAIRRASEMVRAYLRPAA